MLKADKLRAQLTAAVPWLKQNPENLWVGIRKGTLVATGQASAAFEYRYQLEILVLDYPGDLDFLSAVILAWARVHQPDLIFNPDKRAREISFMADILANRCADILYSMPTDEAVLVQTDASGKVTFNHRDEPDYAALMGESHTAWDLDVVAMMDGEPDDERSE
ncbi:phage tail protein [Serratia marcescens]|uniref:phage tail protein n=1 Tax=Serratia marcescens TaxID=615 RepID=UPI0024C481B4|nr:phage tail protein [Serratia marcescens]MDK1707012.1 phage tail protein [Serratia marcescens]